MGNDNPALREVRVDRAGKTIRLSANSEAIPTRDFMNYLKGAGIEANEVLPIWQGGQTNQPAGGGGHL